MDLRQLKLRQASYRGIRFSVKETEHTGGRRTVVHQYPRRDEPYVEDIGRAAREYSLTAYIVGEDYISRTQKLMAALESPGSGKLVHPWLGELTVVPTQVGTANFSQNLGLATVSLTFVEAGKLENPSSAVGWTSKLRAAVDSLMQSAAQTFADTVQLDGVQDYVVAATNDAWEIARSVFTQDSFLTALGVSQQLLTIPSRLMAVNPKAFADSVISATAVNTFVGSFNSWRDMSVNFCSMSRRPELEQKETSDLIVDSSDKIITQNENAVNDLVRAIMVANAAGCASLVGTEYDSDEPLSYEDLIKTRDVVIDALDYEAVYTPSDTVSELAETVRTNVFYDLTERARESARLITLDVIANTPLVVVAYSYYKDAERAGEIGKMNNVRHYGFSPYGGLKALSE